MKAAPKLGCVAASLVTLNSGRFVVLLLINLDWRGLRSSWNCEVVLYIPYLHVLTLLSLGEALLSLRELCCFLINDYAHLLDADSLKGWRRMNAGLNCDAPSLFSGRFFPTAILEKQNLDF